MFTDTFRSNTAETSTHYSVCIRETYIIFMHNIYNRAFRQLSAAAARNRTPGVYSTFIIRIVTYSLNETRYN